jgi:hypothetical protein
MRYCNIKAYDYRDKDNITEYYVCAVCVQGDTGFRAWFPDPDNPDMIMEASGDDGHWWITGEFAGHWLPEMVEAINLAAEKWGVSKKKSL